MRVVDTASKYIVKSTGTKSETDQELVDAKSLQAEQMVQK